MRPRLRTSLLAAAAAACVAAVSLVLETGISELLARRSADIAEFRSAELTKNVALIAVLSVTVFFGVGIALERVQRRRALDAEQGARATLAQRRAAVGSLAASVGHDLRNYLTVVGGNIELVLDCDDLPPRHRERLAAARKGLERAVRLSRNLDALGRAARESDVAFIDVVALVDETLALARHHAGARDAVLRRAPCGTDFEVHGSPGSLASALLNLVLNAIEAVGGGAVVEVRLSAPDAERVRIEVHDNGPGVAPDLRERVFEPLFTTKATGTGLGLPSVRASVRAQGGAVSIGDSDLGGACFVIDIPRRVPQRPPQTSGTWRRAVALANAAGGVEEPRPIDA